LWRRVAQDHGHDAGVVAPCSRVSRRVAGNLALLLWHRGVAVASAGSLPSRVWIARDISSPQAGEVAIIAGSQYRDPPDPRSRVALGVVEGASLGTKSCTTSACGAQVQMGSNISMGRRYFCRQQALQAYYSGVGYPAGAARPERSGKRTRASSVEPEPRPPQRAWAFAWFWLRCPARPPPCGSPAASSARRRDAIVAAQASGTPLRE
jgi:hypothetical protein